jgi:type IV pilus assembly protein PilP
MMGMRLVCILAGTIVFVSCGGGAQDDLEQFIAETKSRPSGKIEAIPTYPPYESFIYSATSMRSPFDRPIDIQARVIAARNSNVRPNLTRTPEHLESFDLTSLSMVGTITWGPSLYAMIQDHTGQVHNVLPGNYLGKNHGKILSIDNTKLELMEIVSDGLDGWVERPRVLALVEKD